MCRWTEGIRVGVMIAAAIQRLVLGLRFGSTRLQCQPVRETAGGEQGMERTIVGKTRPSEAGRNCLA